MFIPITFVEFNLKKEEVETGDLTNFEPYYSSTPVVPGENLVRTDVDSGRTCKLHPERSQAPELHPQPSGYDGANHCATMSPYFETP